MAKLDLFLPLTKVDIDSRMVHGVATAEAPDRAGEICDYGTTKPYFEAWANGSREASAGKSLGAVRAMHQRVAAGKLTDIAFDDDGKRILVAAKIVDEDAWAKVLEGVYTGFSQGGRYVARWTDAESGLTRYTAEPSEISLVDVPCLPGATFQLVKDGVVEQRAFAAAAEATDEDLQETPAPGPATPPPPPQASRASSSQALVKAALAVAGAADKLEKAIEENSRLRAALDLVTPQLAALAKRVAELEAQPLPPRAALRAASREWDGAAEPRVGGVETAVKTLSELPEKERTMALLKVSLANPIQGRL